MDGPSDGRHRVPEQPIAMATNTPEAALARGEVEAQHLLRRAPNSYLFNQAYGLWLFLSLFLLTILITHNVSTRQYGFYITIQAAMNTILYLVALGLEEATATFAPRIFAEQGPAAAARLIRRLLGLRLLVLAVVSLMIIFGLPVLATLIALVPLTGSAGVATSLRDPVLLAHTLPVALYVVGTSVANLLSTVYATQMRMRQVFFIGSAIQLTLLAGGFLMLRAGAGVDGVLWTQAIVALLSAGAYAVWQAPLLLTRAGHYTQPLKPVIRLGVSAWLTNLASGALLKQISIILLLAFTAKLADTYIAYFNVAFQIADAANLLLVSGFIGVGGSAIAAAFVGNSFERLAQTWQALIKVETLLAAPGLVFCLFNAPNIIHTIYGSQYDPAGSLLAIFLFFNILVRILGTTIHQVSLYVIGRPGLVVLSQWIGLATLVLSGIVLVPTQGAAGALIADGIARTVTGVLMLIFLLRKLPPRYPLELLGFTLRFLLALILAAVPGLLWHPQSRILLGVSGVLFIVLCAALLLLIKPLKMTDIEMIGKTNARVVPLLRRFARR